MRFTERLALAFRVLVAPEPKVMQHARTEFGPHCDCGGVEIRELLHVFGSQGHSGASAEITIDLLGKLLRWQPIRPLTGEDDEWVEVGPGVFQNKRCGRVFKQADRFNGQAYDVDGIVWEEPDGSRFTNGDSLVPVTFPYTPTTEYRPRPVAA